MEGHIGSFYINYIPRLHVQPQWQLNVFICMYAGGDQICFYNYNDSDSQVLVTLGYIGHISGQSRNITRGWS